MLSGKIRTLVGVIRMKENLLYFLEADSALGIPTKAFALSLIEMESHKVYLLYHRRRRNRTRIRRKWRRENPNPQEAKGSRALNTRVKQGKNKVRNRTLWQTRLHSAIQFKSLAHPPSPQSARSMMSGYPSHP